MTLWAPHWTKAKILVLLESFKHLLPSVSLETVVISFRFYSDLRWPDNRHVSFLSFSKTIGTIHKSHRHGRLSISRSRSELKKLDMDLGCMHELFLLLSPTTTSCEVECAARPESLFIYLFIYVAAEYRH